MPVSLSNDDRLNLIGMQMQLECVRIESGNIMVPFDCPNPDQPPRVLVADIGDEYRLFVRHDLGSKQTTALKSLTEKECFHNETAVRQILNGPTDVWRNRAYVIGNEAEPAPDERVVRLAEPNDSGYSIFAIVINGEIASACSSSRENSVSGEASVWTDEPHRGQGFATLVVSAWAHDLHRQGKTAFYSHLLENTASQAIARKLGATHFASEVGYS